MAIGALDCVPGDRMKSTESTEIFTVTLSNTSLNETRRDVESQFSKSNTNTKGGIWWTLTVDVPILVIVMLVISLFEMGVIPSFKAGFFCQDAALAFPFTGDTVSTAFLMLTVIFMPVVILFVTELIFIDAEYLTRARGYQAIRNMLWLYRSYFYGLIFNLVIIEVMKGTTGRPRPTFFDICEPDAAKTCNVSQYVTEFKCTSTQYSTWLQSDASHSFPSGHTSMSVHCGLFLMWYLQRRAFKWSHATVLVVPAMQMLLATYSIICSLTRITDHRHHWWDVLAGTVIGVMSMLYSVLVLCDNFSYVKAKSEPRPLLCDERSQVLVS